MDPSYGLENIRQAAMNNRKIKSVDVRFRVATQVGGGIHAPRRQAELLGEARCYPPNVRGIRIRQSDHECRKGDGIEAPRRDSHSR